MFGIQYRGFHVEDLPSADISRLVEKNELKSYLSLETFAGQCLLHPRGGVEGRDGPGQLLQRTLQVRLPCPRLPHQAPEHDAGRGDLPGPVLGLLIIII